MPDTILPACAPVCFGVNEILPPGAWMPDPETTLDAIAGLGYTGTELGPPGYLGDGRAVHDRLVERGLVLVGSFLPIHFSRAERFAEERAWLRQSLALLSEAATENVRPYAILSEGFDEPERMAYAGRIPDHPEAWLPTDRFRTLIDNLHRAAEDCWRAGFEPVLHHHAATYIETDDEIRRVLDRMDPSILGLCLDTGHARFGGADPAALAHAYHQLIRHVHLKDVSRAVIERGRAEGKGFEALVTEGAFTELGRGDAGVAEVVAILRKHGYRGWVVVEQDRYLFAGDTLAEVVAAQRRNREYLRSLGI